MLLRLIETDTNFTHIFYELLLPQTWLMSGNTCFSPSDGRHCCLQLAPQLDLGWAHTWSKYRFDLALGALANKANRMTCWHLSQAFISRLGDRILILWCSKRWAMSIPHLGSYQWCIVYSPSSLNTVSTPSTRNKRSALTETPRANKTPTANTPTGSQLSGTTPSRAKTSLKDLTTPNHKQKLAPKNITPSQRVSISCLRCFTTTNHHVELWLKCYSRLFHLFVIISF